MYLILKGFFFFSGYSCTGMEPSLKREGTEDLLPVSTLRSGNSPFPGVRGLPSELNVVKTRGAGSVAGYELCIPKSSRDSPFDILFLFFFIIFFVIDFEYFISGDSSK